VTVQYQKKPPTEAPEAPSSEAKAGEEGKVPPEGKAPEQKAPSKDAKPTTEPPKK